MCANCGFPAAQGHWTEAGARSAFDRLRARFHRVRVLGRVLSPYGLTVSDDGASPGMTLATKTGHQVIVADLAELWEAAERIAGRAIDPLDPMFTSVDVMDGQASK